MFAENSVGAWLVQVMAGLDVDGNDLTQCWRAVVLATAESDVGSAADLREGLRQAVARSHNDVGADGLDQALRQEEHALTELPAELRQRWGDDLVGQVDRVAEELAQETEVLRASLTGQWIWNEEAGRYWRQGASGPEWGPQATVQPAGPAVASDQDGLADIAELKSVIDRLEATGTGR